MTIVTGNFVYSIECNSGTEATSLQNSSIPISSYPNGGVGNNSSVVQYEYISAQTILRVSIPFRYDGTTNTNGDGISFYGFNNGNISNLTDRHIVIISFGGLCLCSNFGYQFVGLTNLLFANGCGTPIILPNTTLSNCFNGCTSFNSNVDNWVTSNVTNISAMFYSAIAFNQPVNTWNTTNVTDMGSLFCGAVAFNQSVSTFDTHNVTDMYAMFKDASLFNQNLERNGDCWNTSKVENMFQMFYGATQFNGIIGNWDTTHVKVMDSMFNGATSFNQPIGGWNVSNVSSIGEFPGVGMAAMFYNATSFDQPIASWTPSNVTDMASMFAGAIAFNQPLDAWSTSTSNVTNMSSMFEGATAFNQSINSWDVSNVTNFTYIFANAVSFRQPLPSWQQKTVNFIPQDVFDQFYNDYFTFIVIQIFYKKKINKLTLRNGTYVNNSSHNYCILNLSKN